MTHFILRITGITCDHCTQTFHKDVSQLSCRAG